MARLPAALAARFNAQGGGPSRLPAYGEFIETVALPLLRARHPVAPGPVVVMGSSMGGLASLALLMRQPALFRAAGCLSTHWPVLNPEPADAPAIIAAITGWLRDGLGTASGRRIWFDHGDEGLDQYYAPFQAAVDGVWPQLGWQAGRDVVSRSFPGTGHNEKSWAARLALPLGFLFKTA
jgi:enterochelin esterase-like enzyme